MLSSLVHSARRPAPLLRSVVHARSIASTSAPTFLDSRQPLEKNAGTDSVAPSPSALFDEMVGLMHQTEQNNVNEDGVYVAPPASGTLTRSGHVSTLANAKFTSAHMFSIQYATRPAPVGRPAKLGPDARTARQQDPFQKLRIDPRREAFNGTLLRNFISEMGKIKSRSVTGLSMQSQKRVAKAVRRAKMMGVMPVLRKATNNELYGSTVAEQVNGRKRS